MFIVNPLSGGGLIKLCVAFSIPHGPQNRSI
jgi:hypothetical protein